jgi:hypothetical protein
MHLMRFVRRGLVVLFFLSHDLPVGAADLTAFIGRAKAGALSLGSVRTSLDGSPIYGLRFNTNFVPKLGMEHTLAFSSDYLYPKSLSAIKEAKGFVYSSNLIVNLAVGHAVPYLTAGLGLIHQYGSPDLPIGTKFAVNYGGGLKLPKMFGPLGLRIDLRGYSAGEVSSSKLRIFEISGGLLLTF